MECCGDFVGAGEGTDDAHRAAAAEANGDVDAEDAGEQAHPREAMRGRIELLLRLERWLGDGGQFDLSLEDKQGHQNRKPLALGAALAVAATVTVYEGRTVLANDSGSIELAAGERGIAQSGTSPMKSGGARIRHPSR